MRLVAGMLVGVFATFGLTVVAEFLLLKLHAKGVRLPFVELVLVGPLIALVVGSLIGLIAKEKARAAAALGIAPWALLVLGAFWGQTTVSSWMIMLAVASIYLVLGIAAASLVGGRMVRAEARNSSLAA
jgi:uncharacterized membrane protein